MIVRSLLDTVLEENNNEDIKISVSKEDFPRFIHDFVPEDLSFPSEEECLTSFLEVTNEKEAKVENYSFDNLRNVANIVNSYNFSMSECYTLNNNEFDYVCDCPKRESFLENEDFGLKELKALYYYQNFLKGDMGINRDALLKHNYPYSKEVKEGVISVKQFIARATLYSKAFEKIGEKDALSFCNSNIEKAKKVFPLALYASRVWDQMIEKLEFYKEHYFN